ncbi:hypothetical protein Tco_1099174, partial [Tanacetum coccineum]
TENPTIYTSLIQQFWQTASTNTLEDGEVEITATIDGQLKTITEASLRRHLKLEDVDGISSLPNTDIFEQLYLMGYASNSDKLTFQKDHFSPQWIFLIHTILHCLSPKKTAWEQFCSNIATAIICLATNRTFNFSKMIFEGIVNFFDSRFKCLMYPRFIQILLNKHQRLLLPDKRTYVAPTLTQKLFSNMKRVSKGYTGVNILLFSSMLVQVVNKSGKLGARFKACLHQAHHEEDLEDPSKQGRRIAEIDQNPSISLVQDEATLWIQEDAGIQGRTSADTKILLDQEEPTDLVGDLGSGEKVEKEISTANIPVSTSSATLEVSTAAGNLMYIRRSAEKRKDKGKAIMKEDESVQKKTKKARQEQEVVAEADQAHDIDWSAPAVLRYHAVQNRSLSKAKDSEIEKEMMKRPGFNFQQKSSKKRSREDLDEDNAKKHKLEVDAEKKELRDSMNVVVPRNNIVIDVESLVTKYPIVDWKTHVLTENMMYYQIIRGDGSSKNYKIFSEMLNDFDRQDVMDLHRLVQESLGEDCWKLNDYTLTASQSKYLNTAQENNLTVLTVRLATEE